MLCNRKGTLQHMVLKCNLVARKDREKWQSQNQIPLTYVVCRGMKSIKTNSLHFRLILEARHMPNQIIKKRPLVNYFITELAIQIKANGRKI